MEINITHTINTIAHHNLPEILYCSVASYIKTHGSESRGQEEAACMRVFWPTQPLQ